MNYRQNDIIELFKLRPFGTKGWFYGSCPFCGQSDKFGIKFDSFYQGKKVSSFNCFHGDCKKHGNVYQLLKEFNRLDLVSIKFVDIFKHLEEKKIVFDEKDIDYSLPECDIPLGYKRIYSHPYLTSRGFDERFFKIHNVGISSLDPRVGNDYVVFLIEENNKCVGWLKRSIYSKEYIKKLEESGKKVLRWGNSKGTDFEKCIYGIDEIVKGETDTMILVEGVTSKQNVDKLLNLYDRNDIKCGVTFGKKISIFQIKKLLDCGIKMVILLFDTDAINQSKMYSIELEKYFNVGVGFIKNYEKDPGDLNIVELESVLSNLESPLNYKINKLQKKSLYGN